MPPDATRGSGYPPTQTIVLLLSCFIHYEENNDQQEEETNLYYEVIDAMTIQYGLKKIKEQGYLYATVLSEGSQQPAFNTITATLEISQFISVCNMERRKYKLPALCCNMCIYTVEDSAEEILNIPPLRTGDNKTAVVLTETAYGLAKEEYKTRNRGSIAATTTTAGIYMLETENYLPVYSMAGAEHFIRIKLKKNLPPQLTYHGYHHTEDVLKAVLQIAAAENITTPDVQLLRIAALFHDSGFTELYKAHEEKGCEIAKAYLPLFGFMQAAIDCICGMIMATKIPQQPYTKLEEILCDADLDYLGRDDFYTISNTLREEFMAYAILTNQHNWDAIQVAFLSTHQYFTSYSKKERAPRKQQYLAALKRKLLMQ